MGEYETASSGRTMSKRKKFILKVAVWIVAFLVVCTFVSNSIYTMLLPKVETAKSEYGTLTTETSYSGKIYFSGEEKIKAVTPMKVTDVLVAQGDQVKKGDPLLSVDPQGYSLQEKRLKLALLQLENQLKPAESSAAQKKEAQLQLDIAKKEYELFELNNEIQKAIKADDWAIKQLKYQEQSDLTQAQLTAAYTQWQKYSFASADFDRTEEIKLRNKIASYQRQLKNTNLSADKKTELELNLQIAEAELAALTGSSSDAYDEYIQERQLRVAVIQAQNNVLLLDETLTADEKNSAQLEYDKAQKEYQNYLKTDDIQTAISEQKLKLDIVRYENQLNPQALSATQKSAINLQIDIAKQELADFQASMPSDGVIKAPFDCSVIGVSATVTSQANAGDVLVTISPSAAIPYVEWETSYEAGNSFFERATINARFKVQPANENDFVKQKDQTIEVDSKRFDDITNTWHFTAKLGEVEGEIRSGTVATVSLKNESEMYQSIVPLACISKNAQGKDTVLQVSTRKGIFSEETYVEEIVVKVLEKNNFYAALDAQLQFDAKLVKHTSKPLRTGDVVYIK